jgi:hypothetical protein
MQSSPASCHFLPLRSKYSPQHPVLKHHQCIIFRVRDQVAHPYKTKCNCIVCRNVGFRCSLNQKNVLVEFGIPVKVVTLIKMCYSEVRTGKSLSDAFSIQNGPKEGDSINHCFSAMLQNMLSGGTINEWITSADDVNTKVYLKVSGLAAWSENCKWYSSLPLGALVSLFYESV